VTAFYDSDARGPTAWDGALRLWQLRGLVRLLVVRDLGLRYKRSALGAWWTLLNPLLEMATLAVIFSQVFRFSATGVPYVVYLLSGIVLANLFRNSILRTAGSLAENAPALSRLRVPAEVFSLSAALEVAVNFLVSLLPLAAIMIIAGEPISLTAPLLVLPTALLVAFGFGVGLALAPLAVRFSDALVFSGILLTFATYLAPVFYPFSIVPDRFRLIVELNPLYHFLKLFRATIYGDSLGQLSDYAIVAGYTALSVAVGSIIFARTHAKVVSLL
jgi:ABC-2 type transport system permease protein